jgi:hypothetical protein
MRAASETPVTPSCVCNDSELIVANSRVVTTRVFPRTGVRKERSILGAGRVLFCRWLYCGSEGYLLLYRAKSHVRRKNTVALTVAQREKIVSD